MVKGKTKPLTPAETVQSIYRDAINSQGKGVRSQVLRKSYEYAMSKFGGNSNATSEPVNQASEAIEQLHLATLIHDDIIDEEPSRRGEKSVFSKYGTKIALLAGDTVLVDTLQKFNAIGYGSAALTSISTIIQGQFLETVIVSQSIEQPLESDLLTIVKQKTAELFSLATTLGVSIAAVEANVPKEKAMEVINEAVMNGLCYGIVYQLKDDLTDVEADKLAKTPTIPLVYGTQRTQDIIATYEAEISYLGSVGA